MRYTYQNDPTLCRAPLLGNGDLALAMDAEGGITPRLPAPVGLPSSALYRLGKRNAEGGPLAYCHLTPSLSFLGRDLGCPFFVTSEFSTDEALFSSSCKYDRGVSVETRAAVLHGHPVLMVTKHFRAQGPIVFSYELLPMPGLALSVKGDLLVGELASGEGRERLCLWSPSATPAVGEDGRGRLVANLPKKATVTFYLFFAETEDPERLSLDAATEDMKGFLYTTGEKALLSRHISRWQSKEGAYLTVEDGTLGRLLDGSRYLLRTLGGLYGTREGMPSPDLRLFTALLREGCTAEAARLLPTLIGRIPKEEKQGFALFRPFRNRTPHRASAAVIADAATAIYRYYEATGDRFFLAREGFPAILRAARILLDEVVRVGYSDTYVLAPDPIVGGVVSMRPHFTSLAVSECLASFAAAATALGLEPHLAQDAARAAAAITAGLPRPPQALCRPYDLGAGRAAFYLPVYSAAGYVPPIPDTPATTPYERALLSAALAARRLPAVDTLRALGKTADEFGFLPHGDGAAPGEVAALFLEAYARSIAEPAGDTVYLGFGLGEGAPNTDFRLPLVGGLVAEGKLRDGRFAAFRLLGGPARTALREAELVVEKELYTPGAAVAVRKTERDGRLSITTVLH